MIILLLKIMKFYEEIIWKISMRINFNIFLFFMIEFKFFWIMLLNIFLWCLLVIIFDINWVLFWKNSKGYYVIDRFKEEEILIYLVVFECREFFYLYKFKKGR